MQRKGDLVERKLIKAGIYGFIIGLLIGVVLFPDKETIKFASGVKEITYEPMRVYLMKLIRFSALLSLFAVAGVWLKEKLVITNGKTGFVQFIRGWVLSFVLVLAVILLASLFVGVFR